MNSLVPASRTIPILLYLLALAGGSVWLAESCWLSVTGYRSGYALDRRFEAGPPLAGRVVLIVLDGIRVDRAESLPAFNSLKGRGASGTMRVTMPSLSNPARAAIVTGAWPEVSGVTNNSDFAPPPVQSLFSLARERDLRVSVYDFSFWARAFGEYIGGMAGGPSGKLASYEPADLIAWQADACREALALVGDSEDGLQIVGLLAGDEAGHTYGGDSDGYREVTAAVDDCLGQIADAAGGETTIVAVSDHGHIDRRGKGGHGGEEPEVILAPFAMAGPGVRESQGLEAHIVDIAPTVSVLLGLPIPANNQGSVLWDALEVPAEHLPALRDLERVQREALDAHMPNRDESLAAQRTKRLPAAIAFGAWFALLAVSALARGWGWKSFPRSIAVAAAIFGAVYYILFFAFQLGYSLSSMVRQEYVYSFLGRMVLVAALAFGTAAYFVRKLRGPGGGPIVQLSVLVTSVFGLFVTATFYIHGLRMDDWMIELGPGFAAYLNLVSILGVVLATIAAVALDAVFTRRQGQAS